jgi:hypothetical protein
LLRLQRRNEMTDKPMDIGQADRLVRRKLAVRVQKRRQCLDCESVSRPRLLDFGGGTGPDRFFQRSSSGCIAAEDRLCTGPGWAPTDEASGSEILLVR